MKKYVWGTVIFILLDSYRAVEPGRLAFSSPETASVLIMFLLGCLVFLDLIFFSGNHLKNKYGLLKVYATGFSILILSAIAIYYIHVHLFYFELIIAKPFEYFLGDENPPVLILSTFTIRDFLIFVWMSLYCVLIMDLGFYAQEKILNFFLKSSPTTTDAGNYDWQKNGADTK